MSIKAIAMTMPAAQSSVSIWTREVELNNDQKLILKQNTHSRVTIEKRRQSRLVNEEAKRNIHIEAAAAEIGTLTDRELKLICASLYWAEGAKKRGAVQFSNGDPNMIRLMLHFLRHTQKVDETKLRGHIHIHEHLDPLGAEKYWQKVTGISASQFYKTYNKPNKSSKNTKNSLPYGVCDIYVMDTKLFLTIKGWTKGIYQSVDS